MKDSLQNEELMRYYQENPEVYQTETEDFTEDTGGEEPAADDETNNSYLE